MNRRAFVTGLGAVLAAPRAAEAQQAGKVYRIGYLTLARVPTIDHAFLETLRELGYVEGQNIVIEFRDAGGNTDRLPALASDLVRLNVDAIVAWSAPGAFAAKRATSSIPIIVPLAGDLLETGLVDSLARPGGNITGMTNISPETSGKRLQLLKEAFPSILRVAVLWNPEDVSAALTYKATESAARTLALTLRSVEVRHPQEFEHALSAITPWHAEALVTVNDAMIVAARQEVVKLAAKNRLPAMYERREFVDAGGLMSYGPNFADIVRRAARYTDISKHVGHVNGYSSVIDEMAA
jgi:putative tryptophan/tyrosine transport system substrate-binding protein